MARVLVVANLTAGSEELLEEMKARAARGPTQFTLLVPRSERSKGQGVDPLEASLARMRDGGLEVESLIADADPILAVSDHFDPHRHDEIIVATLPVGASKWLQIDLPHRIARMTSAPVTHIVGAPAPRQATNLASTPARRRPGVLRPLEVLTWSGHQRRD